MYRELLVPVDNSQHSDWAVDRAIEIADRFDGHLTASHVYAARLHDVRFRQLEVGLPARFQDPEEIRRQRKVHDKLIEKGLQLISDSFLNEVAEQVEQQLRDVEGFEDAESVVATVGGGGGGAAMLFGGGDGSVTVQFVDFEDRQGDVFRTLSNMQDRVGEGIAGADVVIASGADKNVLRRVVAREAVGTRFPALETPLENRKRWILAGPSNGREIRVDEGAAHALRDNGSSLLPAGIVTVGGRFDRGDTVSIIGPDEVPIARGIARYSRSDMESIIGCRSDEIHERLGYAYGPVAVHRNDMILL